MVVKGNYKSTEKIFLVASVVYIAYIFAGVLSQPSWSEALLATVQLPERSVWRDKAYIYMAIGVVGTTIAPWMQFYLQSSIVEKGIRVKDYAASRLDVIVGSFFTDIVAWFIVVACAATLFVHGMGAIAGGSRRGGSDAAAGGRLCVYPVRVRAVQCVAVCGFDSAAFHGVHGVRRPGFRVGRGQELQRGADVLLALHAADRGWRDDVLMLAGRAADQLCDSVAGVERRAAAGGDHPDADADQSPGPDGQAQEFAPVERGCMGHQHHRDWDDGSDALGNDSGALKGSY